MQEVPQVNITFKSLYDKRDFAEGFDEAIHINIEIKFKDKIAMHSLIYPYQKMAELKIKDIVRILNACLQDMIFEKCEF